jgi:hypothetical protein
LASLVVVTLLGALLYPGRAGRKDGGVGSAT